MTTKTDLRTAQAEIAAADYARLVRDGRLPEADRVASTIDDLCGRWLPAGFAWPSRIAQIAGVSRIRRSRCLPGAVYRRAVDRAGSPADLAALVTRWVTDYAAESSPQASGGRARAATMSPEQRQAHARRMAEARWRHD